MRVKNLYLLILILVCWVVVSLAVLHLNPVVTTLVSMVIGIASAFVIPISK